MKKYLKTAFLVIVFLIVLIFSGWWFFPWVNTGEYVASHVSQTLRQNGILAEWDNVTSRGRIRPVISFNNVKVNSFAGRLSFQHVKIKPRALVSLTGMGLVFNISFPESLLRTSLVEQQDLEIKGSLDLRAGLNTIDIEQVSVTGDIGIKGDLSIDPDKRKFSYADIDIEVPEQMDSMFYSLGGFLPINRISSGQWELSTGSDN